MFGYRGHHGGTFEATYRAFPLAFIDKQSADYGDKVILPPTALHRLGELGAGGWHNTQQQRTHQPLPAPTKVRLAEPRSLTLGALFSPSLELMPRPISDPPLLLLVLSALSCTHFLPPCPVLLLPPTHPAPPHSLP